MKKLLKPLASLWLTVPLLLLSMLLIYAGTTIQKQMGTQEVQKHYFHSWFVWVPLDPLLRPFAAAGTEGGFPGGFWMLGGYSFIVLLLANLLAAHTVRFKLRWKRSGIILIHLGLITLLVGEICASFWSVESMMQIDEGQTVQYSSDIRHVELAVSDTSPADHDTVTVFDASLLRDGATLQPPGAPFTIRIDNYYSNSQPVGPMQSSDGALQKQNAGANRALRIFPEANVPATSEATDLASAFVTLRSGSRDLGTYLLSQWSTELPQLVKPESVTVDGKTWKLDLRFRRYYKPYSVKLIKFSHDVYPGTDEASNFASLVQLVDPSRHVDRQVKIWMNHPLTYQGETFYQQNFKNQDHTTVLQVTHNPTWLMPYIGLALGLVGLLIHFGMALVSFLRRQAASAATPASQSRPSSRRVSGKSRVGSELGSSYTLEPQTNWLARLTGLIAATLVVVTFFGVCIAPAVEENGFNLSAFGQLPVMSGGRVMPLDTLARTSLKIISGRETLKDAEGHSHPAIRWLTDVMSDVPGSLDYKVIRIDYPDILGQFGLDSDRKFFSMNELQPHWKELVQQIEMASQVPEKQRDLYQTRMAELGDHLKTFVGARDLNFLLFVPPQTSTGKWLPLTTNKGQLTPGGEPMYAILGEYRDGLTAQFNQSVASYHDSLTRQHPSTITAVDYEAFFNKAEPFFLSLWFYVLVFVLACCSWLGWRRPFWAAAMGVLVVTLCIHTFGLGSRVYLTGRGPVTNLYASALFIAWAAVLLGIGLEVIYRNGLGAAMASLVGFASLLVAHNLGNDGDTMKPVVAVLATNFWLWTHVPCVTLGYASTFLSGALAIGYVLLGVFTGVLDDSRRKALARMAYGITCFAILFSFVGTILGGIWADYSWGRFWGWDPKENGAILIVLWNAIILHARWGGIVRERGFMLLAILGNVVTAWSWFGTNLLGIGLHSYGFMEGAATWLIVWCVTQLVLVGIGLIPTSMWKSLAPSIATNNDLTATAV